MLDEAERSLHDALCVLAATVKDARVVLGGGFPEMAMARVVRALAPQPPQPHVSLVLFRHNSMLLAPRLALKPTLRAQAAWRCSVSLCNPA